MGEIATSERQITLFYSSKSERAKQTLAYAKAEGVPIQQIDILKTKLTGTQIAELADRLHINKNIQRIKHNSSIMIFHLTIGLK